MKLTDRLTPHFLVSDLACSCCGWLGPKEGESIRKTALFLETIRVYLGNRPITVNSGARCVKHNRDVGGEPNSFHLLGQAADIVVAGLTARQVQRLLSRPDSPVAQHGMGSYGTFTHVDRRGVFARWNR